MKPRTYSVLRGATRVAALVAWLCVLASPVVAKSWRISNFQDTITINEDGSALVNENITWCSWVSGTGYTGRFRLSIPGRRDELPAVRERRQRHG